MANNEQVAPLPRTTLISGMTIAFEAIDPTTGAPVAGVEVSVAAVYGDDGNASVEAVTAPSVQLPSTTPLWAPIPVTEG